MRVTWVSGFLVSVILDYFDDCTVFSMESLMIGITFIRNINPHPIADLKSPHWLVLLLLCPVSYGWY
ncbi:hypothetical protein HLRTI_003390 [Halorhabdus tiamatea SARL4B]|uniref:Uncharacterized protein n=1 Tax=Halorhabdus tiamatea SARL4B TaxID=1033806 RepID=U2F7V7_9EURY|nr:hypothetical protein HLRTI_003390 [Halorhabdus tiamatea SARL4B]